MLRTSFDLILEREPNLTSRFYDNLFSRYPQAKPMFHRSPRATQEKMLAGALVSVLDHLEDAPWLVETLGAMGIKHVEYGVTPEMYPWVGDALVATLAEVAGADWSEELAREWGAAYGAITSLMLAGARTAEAAE
ncbi:flavohemoprotein [Minicystis rosea]|nr:flavohemoprotein [Minicystis rosea]